MRILNNIEPENVFYWFEEFSNIPHGSGNMGKISEFCENFAKERNLFCIRDEYNNVIIKKEGAKGYENSEPVILQAHLDMVCEKTDDTKIDFLNEPIRLAVKDDLIYAKGTTLGGDNGIGVAYILALLDSSDVAHPPLEAIFTIDEEIGLIGAGTVDLSSLKSKRLINLDIEEEGRFIVSCAGGATAECSLPIERKTFNGTVYEIILSGFKGGHSGTEIDKNRGNSNVLMGRLLNSLILENKINIAEIAGGLKDNVIPVKTSAVIVADKELDSCITEYADILKNEYKTSDGDITVTYKKHQGSVNAADEKTTKDIIFLLTALPDGIQKMSAEIEGLPETSLNMGKLLMSENNIKMSFALRSSIESSKKALINKIKAITEYAGGKVEISGVYSGWQYNKDSDLRKVMLEVYKKLYNKEPIIEAIHAGLECGMLCEKIEGLDCISVGPDIFDIHTPSERASISSVKRTWEFLCETLKELK